LRDSPPSTPRRVPPDRVLFPRPIRHTSPSVPMRARVLRTWRGPTPRLLSQTGQGSAQRRHDIGVCVRGKIGRKPECAPSAAGKVNFVAEAQQSWPDRGFGFKARPNSTLHGPGPNRSSLQTLPAPCPTWTGEGVASPRPTELPAGGHREATDLPSRTGWIGFVAGP